MKYLRLLILTIAIGSMTLSCSDFLEERSQDEVIPSTVADFREILYYYQPVLHSQSLLVLDDDVMIDLMFSEFIGTATILSLEGCLTWQPDVWERANTVDNGYESMYETIKAMNAILEEIDDADGTTEEKEILKAQALGTRAYYYFVLVNMFGEPYNYNKEAPGVVLKLDVAYVGEGMPRSSVEEVYAAIVSDLETASAILNKYPKQRADFLINCTATDVLLSRVYLYMEEWDKAIVAADRAIESAEGLLDYTTSSFSGTYDNPEMEWIFGRFIQPSLLLVVPSDDLVATFDGNDRRTVYLNRLMKISEFNNVTIRSAEAYLNRAEAKVLSATPDLAGALSDLNELRRHRIIGYSDVSITDAEMLLDEIRKERRKELCFEGHRWFDLRRYGMPSITRDLKMDGDETLLRYTLEEKDPFYTLPIPRIMMESNVALEQNPSASLPERVGVPVN